MLTLERQRALPHGEAHLIGIGAEAVLPRQVLTVSEWAERHRYLTAKQSGERGRWRTERTPYLREIMDCLSAHSRVTDVVIMKSSQVGATEATVNWLGYIMEHAPAPAMVLMPSLEARDAWKVQKLNPLLTDTPVIRDLLGGIRSRDAANRQDMIDFPGGVLFLAGGNSPNSYAQRSVRYLVLDDLDRFPTEIGTEGDPVALAKGRTKAFPRAKRLFISTPTVNDQSLIEREYAASDQRRYHVACPHCETYQPLVGEQLHYSPTAGQAWYVCPHCAATIAEHQKPQMLAAGRWMATHPERQVRGYHLSALYAPIGLGPSWLDLARDRETAQSSIELLKTFTNTELGLPFTEEGDAVEPVALLSRLETYPDELPEIVCRTAGVDIQKDRIETTIVDWQADESAWVHDHLILPGDTTQAQVWADLHEALTALQVTVAAVDIGYLGDLVRDFCRTRGWAYPVMGRDGASRPIVEDERRRRQRLRKKHKTARDEIVGVEIAKALLFQRLRLTDTTKPGFVHFPAEPAFDDEYFAQLTAEKLVQKMVGTRKVARWVQTRPRNEALDCFVYALAALRLPRPQQAGGGAQRVAAPRPVRGSFVGRWRGNS